MNFMLDIEFLLLMAHCEDRAHGFEKQHILSTEERARLYEVGIRTAHEQPPWLRVEPSYDNYDFGYLDNIISRNRNAGLKSLIQLPGWRVPKWVSPEWKARREGGMYEDEQLSFWNVEAQEHTDKYIQTVMDHYPDEDIGFFFGGFQGGEGAYPPTWCVYDESALEDYRSIYGTSARPIPNDPETMKWLGDKVIEYYLTKCRIIYQKHHEVWNCQQWLMNEWNKGYGNFVQPEIMRRSAEEFPDGKIVLLQYTYYDDSHPQANTNYVDMLINISKCETIVEAMFPAGLPTTTPKAIAKGFRGQIVCPAHEAGGEAFTDMMVNNIRDSHNLWMQNYEDSRDRENV